MNLKNIFKSVLIVIISLITTNNTIQAQCFQIESILVDACGSQEGLNEMVRFKVGNTPLNTNSLTISWPNNPWQGLIKNNVTASKVATLNADILDAGGCGQLIEPVGGIIPANATAIIVTSHNMDTALNSFGAITENIYIIFQNNPTTASGHFANSGAGNRTLNMSFGSCSDTATYNRELLIDESGNTTSGDGATVLFSENGTATYVNYGCTAPVPPFTVDAGNSQSGCTGATISLTATGLGYQSVSWSAPTGTFSAPNSLATNYTIGNNVGTVVLTITATDSCGSTISDTVTITVTSGVTPNFPLQMTLCGQNPAPTLQNVSPNGISGTWFPTAINLSQSGSYVFTPNNGQCAQSVTLQVEISQNIIPNFPLQMTLCGQNSAPTLQNVSPNGISGTWFPTTINLSQNGSYVFTPNAGQCASSVTLQVEISQNIIPNFPLQMTLCGQNPAPTLQNISPNGISGTWFPTTINLSQNGSYVFTPNAGQCAQSVTLQVEISQNITPNFPLQMTLCGQNPAPTLQNISPNGISGTWFPTTINISQSGSYVFTPNAGQCASSVTLEVEISQNIIPNFPLLMTLCGQNPAPTLQNVSPNGISGTWFPTTINISQSGSYVFTPNVGQCAQSVTLEVAIGSLDFSIEKTCMDGDLNLQPIFISEPQNESYQWRDANGNIISTDAILNVTKLLQSTSVVEQFPLTYNLTITESEGCSAQRQFTVNSAFCNIQKGISPNNDNANDTFDLSGLGVTELQIFNRYGMKVYNRKNYANEWNGVTDKGEELPDGTYYYIISIKNSEPITGWIYIIRAQN